MQSRTCLVPGDALFDLCVLFGVVDRAAGFSPRPEMVVEVCQRWPRYSETAYGLMRLDGESSSDGSFTQLVASYYMTGYNGGSPPNQLVMPL
jgi:hypothetical protein